LLESHARRPGLVVFDVEGVLVPKKRFLFFEVSRNIRFSQFLKVVFYGFLYEMGLISLKNALSHVFKVFKGMRTDAPLDFFREVPLMPDAEEVFWMLRREGWKTALISSGLPAIAVQDLASKLHADYGFGLELKARNGILTGEISGDVIEKNGKLRVLREILAREELLPEDCVIVADDRNNLSIFLSEAFKIGYNPDFVIRVKADAVVSGQLNKVFSKIAEEPIQSRQLPTKNEATREAIHASGFLISIVALAIGIFPVVLFISFVVVLYAVSEARRMERTNLPIISSVTRYAATHEELYELATAPLFFALGIVLTLLAFPMPVSGAAIAAFALGDSTASLFGKAFGKTWLPFNKGKTLEGSVISFFFAFLASLYFVAPLPALVAASTAVIVESLPLPLNDNLVTPLVTGLILALTIS
jgi:dolichol kinase/phosphoserine phosphatase